jgi:predicted enzyme related to lactoylglutathione lyase
MNNHKSYLPAFARLKKIVVVAGLIIMASCSKKAYIQTDFKAYGVQINVTDMAQAIAFYRDVLGFSIKQPDPNGNLVMLTAQTGPDAIFLNKVSGLPPENDNQTRASFTLQVNNLDSCIAVLKNKGMRFGKYQKRKEGVGWAIYIDDPFGTRISLMHETIVDNPPFKEPRVYNYGFYVPDMDAAKAFFTSLGFVVRSEKYLPLDLPLGHSDKSFAFMLHQRDGTQPVQYNSANNEHIVILFRCNDIRKAKTALKSKKIKLAKGEDSPFWKAISFYDPSGYVSKVVEIKKQ